MNSTDLTKKVYKTLEETGLLNEITEHVRNNPKLFGGTDSGLLITSLNVSISFIALDYHNVLEVLPDVYISIGGLSTAMYELNVWSNEKSKSVEQTTWIAGDKVTELYEPNVKEITYE